MTWEVTIHLHSYYSAIATVCVLIMCRISSATNNDDEFQNVNVSKLAPLPDGTELLLLENTFENQRTYKLEDFFWTGSGDGSPDDDSNSTEKSTIYKTKTIFSTVYVETPSTFINQNNTGASTTCSYNCEHPHTPDGEINPTPTYDPHEQDDETLDADSQFWLLTVLKSDGKDPVIIDLKNSLAKLYKTAFQRQQERHLGINNRSKRQLQNVEKPVNVYIHNITKTPENGNEKIEVLYHVAVAGKPVAATTAAADMDLVSDEEVTKELGYPFLIKAEPYLKMGEPQATLAKSRSTWIFIGTSILVLLVILLLLAFIMLGCTKRKRSALDNKRKVFEEGGGHDNKGFLAHSEKERDRSRSDRHSPTYIDFKHQTTDKKVKTAIKSKGSQSSLSSSISSGSSLDISPLMALRKQKTPLRKPVRPKAALNKTAPLKTGNRLFALDSDSSSDSQARDSPETIFIGNCDPGVVSPKSYLSMPSVKSFPNRGNMPEPLNKVLEPVSVLHLDMADNVYPDPQEVHPARYNTVLVRHGSVGAVEDPGVVGPIVWNMHCQRLQHGVSVDEGINDLRTASNVVRMRKRFHDLLDDTFSLFSSHRNSPIAEKKPPPIEVKSHSAANTRQNGDMQQTLRVRPKTASSKSTDPGSDPPRGAWTSTVPSPLVRPLSAGIIQSTNVRDTTINIDHVLAEGTFQPNDPAVPLIAAIKTELGKCSLPGSTTNLNE